MVASVVIRFCSMFSFKYSNAFAFHYTMKLTHSYSAISKNASFRQIGQVGLRLFVLLFLHRNRVVSEENMIRKTYVFTYIKIMIQYSVIQKIILQIDETILVIHLESRTSGLERSRSPNQSCTWFVAGC